MKHTKILGLLAVAAAAMMAFAGSASATTVTDLSGSSTPTIHAVHEGTHVELHNSIAAIPCNSTIEGSIPASTEGGTGKTPGGFLSAFVFNNCTNEWHVEVVSTGFLEIHYLGVGSGHGEGTLTSSGATVTALHTPSGLTCGYRTVSTDIGKVTGGNGATFDIAASIPRHTGSFLCGGSTGNWTGTYKTTSTLKIDP